MLKFLSVVIFVSISLNGLSQSLLVKADNYLQTYEGAGVSSGLYLGHHYSMASSLSQDSAIKLAAKYLNMRYLQDYIDRYPADDPAYFDRRADYIKACKVYRPDIQVSQVGNKFPAALMIDSVIGGIARKCLNTLDTAIYTKVAEWYFLMFKAFKERGVEVDILNVVNEPDYNKVYYYGPNGFTKNNVSLIFDKAVNKFLAMLANPTINTLNIKVPKIMGPSTISPQGCIEYIDYFKANYPNVWAMINIVSYHQYVNGVNAGYLSQIKSEAGARLVYQSEMHTNMGDNLGTLPISDELRGCLSLGSLFGNAMRTGCNTWFYFQTNYPNVYTEAGLFSITWQALNPTPYKQYYAYQQFTSTQPINSKMLEHLKTNLPNVDVFNFRKQNGDSVYINLTNISGFAITIPINIASTTGQFNIKKYQMFTTNISLNNQPGLLQVNTTPQTQFTVTLTPYSVNTIVVDISNLNVTSINQTILPNTAIKIIPTSNSRILTATTNNLFIKSLLIYNSIGKRITTVGNLYSNRYQYRLPSTLISGVYLFKIITNKGIVIKKQYISSN